MNMSKKTKPIKRHAFAILLYRQESSGAFSVFLAQANGPRYWKREQTNNWGLPKGRSDFGETAFDSAKREFREEIGCELPKVRYKFFMHHVRPKARRQVTVFAARVRHSHAVVFGGSNYQRRQWPAKSDQWVEYPEITDAKWFPLDDAMKHVLPGQKKILKTLRKQLRKQLVSF